MQTHFFQDIKEASMEASQKERFGGGYTIGGLPYWAYPRIRPPPPVSYSVC
jgi:hypothetical protein